MDPWVTRADGTFTASPVTPGRVRARVQHPAYVDGLSDSVMLAPGAEAEVHVVFRSIFLEGLARPMAGVRLILRKLVQKFKRLGGELRLRPA